EGYTAGRDVHFDFRIDATSVVDLINRRRPDQPAVGRFGIEGEARLVLDYLAAGFTVRNGAQACPPALPSRILLHAQTDKVVFSVVFRCAEDLDVLTLRSTLFNEESTPHQMLG